jgi:hypothetical protein
VSDTPETDKEWGNWLHKLKIPIESFVDFARKLERERDKYRRAVTLIAEDCEAWLNSENDEPSAEFIKLVAKYAREAIK